ncbi:hypothetical protein BC835DRAFT_1343998 [Cytidiella melzeri]|nr:hypothetical protein BC835DRAFT_1343998 [Cytidiella melzeri]
MYAQEKPLKCLHQRGDCFDLSISKCLFDKRIVYDSLVWPTVTIGGGKPPVKKESSVSASKRTIAQDSLRRPTGTLRARAPSVWRESSGMSASKRIAAQDSLWPTVKLGGSAPSARKESSAAASKRSIAQDNLRRPTVTVGGGAPLVWRESNMSTSKSTTQDIPLPTVTSGRSALLVRRESSDGDLRKLLKARSPKKNGLKLKPFHITRPVARTLTKETSHLDLKFDTSSPIYNKPQPIYKLPALPPLDPQAQTTEDEVRLCSNKKRRYKKKPGGTKKERAEEQAHTNLRARLWNERPKTERFAVFMEQLRTEGIIPSSRSDVVTGKRKAEEDLADLPMKKSKTESQEYQSVEDLHVALLDALVSNGMLKKQFTGYFSVATPLLEEVDKGKVKAVARQLVRKVGVKLRSDLKPIVWTKDDDGVDVLRLEYQCACNIGCAGKVSVSTQKVKTGFIPGETVTVKIRH